MVALSNHFVEHFGQDYVESLPTLGSAIVEILNWFGCDEVFGVGGDFAANLISALSNHVQLSPAGNEMHAGFTACGFAEFNGIGAVLTTYTVGSLPCTSAAALAITERLPVIFISGAPGEGEISTHSIHHTVAPASAWRTDYDCALNAFKALGMKAERLQGSRNSYQPNMAAERFFQLVAEAYVNKQPVFIEVPRDLVFQQTQALSLPTCPDELARDHFVLKGEGHIAHQIIAKLNACQSPLVYVGENAKLNNKLKTLVMNLCHQFNIPYATSWLAKGILDESHPLSFGSYNGVFSRPVNRHYIEHQVDYILEIDTSIYHQDTNAAFNTGTHFINEFNNKTVIKSTAEDNQGIINILNIVLSSATKRFTAVHQTTCFEKEDDNAKLDFHNLTPTLNFIQQQIAPSLVYIPEIGNSYFASYDLKTRQSVLGRSWLTNPWYAAMGTSLPYARAVAKKLKQLASDDIAVVITGDGGFNFQLNELIHFQREKLTVIIVYMRNDIFHLGKSSDGDIYHCSTPEFNTRKLVEAYGGRGKKCKSVGEFVEIFTQAVTQNRGIILIEVPADTSPEYQSHEIKMLNLYIQAQNGDPKAASQWRKISKNKEQNHG